MMAPRQAAIAAGESKYRNGKPCKNGHAGERYVAGGACVECAVARAQKRYAGKVEEIREYSRARYWREPEKYRAQVAENKARNPEAARLAQQRDYLRHKPAYVARAMAQQALNPEAHRQRAREWHQRNPDKSYENVVRRRMRKLQRTPEWLTAEQRGEIRQLYCMSRRVSQCTGVPHNVDHIVPLQGAAVSGLHVPWNLRVITAAKNRSKGNALEAPGTIRSNNV